MPIVRPPTFHVTAIKPTPVLKAVKPPAPKKKINLSDVTKADETKKRTHK